MDERLLHEDVCHSPPSKYGLSSNMMALITSGILTMDERLLHEDVCPGLDAGHRHGVMLLGPAGRNDHQRRLFDLI